MSWNCGVEGPTDDPGIEAFRERADPELRHDPDALAGRPDVRGRRRGPPDPARQQQRLLPGQRRSPGSTGRWPRRTASLLRFFQQMIAFRKRHPAVHRSRFFTGETNAARPAGHHLARLPAQRAGLERSELARPGLHAGGLRGRPGPPRHAEHGRRPTSTSSSRACRAAAGTAPSTPACRRRGHRRSTASEQSHRRVDATSSTATASSF